MLKARQKLGKYRIEKRLANGPLAAVYRAYDSIHGLRVALKIPHRRIMDDYFLADFRKEVRLTAKLDHPNILSIQNADFISGYFVISMPLGDETLGDRLTRRIATSKALDFTDQILFGSPGYPLLREDGDFYIGVEGRGMMRISRMASRNAS